MDTIYDNCVYEGNRLKEFMVGGENVTIPFDIKFDTLAYDFKESG